MPLSNYMALDIKQSKSWQYSVTANLRSSKELMKSSMLIEYNFTVSRNENFCVRDPFKSLFFQFTKLIFGTGGQVRCLSDYC